jgi:hypothetical protein
MTNTDIIQGAQNLCYGVTVEDVGCPLEGETAETAFLRAKAAEVYLKLVTEDSASC